MAEQVILNQEDNFSGYAGSAAVRCPFCNNKITLSQSAETQSCYKCGSEYTVVVEFELPPEKE
jgi:ribosomal protein S27E